MKRSFAGILLWASLILVGVCADSPVLDGPGPFYEYATVRWMGDKTSIIWPDGSVQKVIAFGGRRRPDGADERVWYLTGAMNIMGRKGFELVHYAADDVVMRRVSPK